MKSAASSGSKTPKSPEPDPEGHLSTDFFSTTLSSSLSKVQQLKKVGGSAILKKKQELSERYLDAGVSENSGIGRTERYPDAGLSDSSGAGQTERSDRSPLSQAEDPSRGKLEASAVETPGDVFTRLPSDVAEMRSADIGEADMAPCDRLDGVAPHDSPDGVPQVVASSRPVTEPLVIDVPLASPLEAMSGAGLLATENTINMDRDAANNAQAAVLREPDIFVTGEPLVDSQASVLREPDIFVTGEPSVDSDDAEGLVYGDDLDDNLLGEPDAAQSGWGDVSLSILTESQVSSASSMMTENTDTVPVSRETVSMETVSMDGSCDKVVCDNTTMDVVETVTTVVSSDCSNQESVAMVTGDNAGGQTITGPDQTVEDIMDTIDSAEGPGQPMVASIAASENAWNIPELTESAFDKLTPESSFTMSGSQPEEGMVVDSGDSAENTFTEGGVTEEMENLDHGDSVVEGMREDSELPESSESVGPVNSVTEETVVEPTRPEEFTSDRAIPAGEDTPILAVPDIDYTPPRDMSSMEGSTDTQDELSGSNRTLTDDLDQPRLSSESSQATLEFNPDDDQLGENAVENIPGKSDPIVKETIPEESPATSPTETVAVKNTGEESKETLTSSSYVRNMLEEAMAESLKETDSYTDSQSHSSSDMVRIESGPTSGHTSADEIETNSYNTSSDIEIISHISTPTPNGKITSQHPHQMVRSYHNTHTKW